MKTETIKGFKDFIGNESKKRAEIKKILIDVFEKYNFEPAETPVIEYEEFVRGNNSNDEAVSDIFKLQDKGKRKLALRYEFTFQLKRLARNKKLPYKRYQIGPVFRDEPIQGNRARQFTQCDIDIIGSSIKDDAEILAMSKQILDNLKIKSVIYVNSRKLLNEIFDEQKIKKNREQVFREIDKLDKISEKEIKKNLKNLNAEKILAIFKKPESYFKKYNSYKEIIKLKKYCKNYGVKIIFQPWLIRGLSYYNGNIFEIKSEIKETICGGGSYLVNGIQSTGISLGLERLSILAKIKSSKEKILVISLNQDKEAIKISQQLRKQGKNVSMFYGKPSRALEYANAYKIQKVIFVGEKEIKNKKFKIKDMTSGCTKPLYHP